MAELNDPAFPSKRKPDSDAQHLPAKSTKFASFDHHETQEPISNDNTPQLPSTANCSSEPKEGANDDNQLQNDNGENEDEDEDEDEDEEEEEHEVDRKGKGVIRDDKGKGKLIEEEEEDDDDSDDDDSDDNGSGSGDDSDFSDDPLAEVDLNNILPSRTRRQTAHSGVRISGDTMNAAAGKDDDDSDDSDA